MKQDCTSSDDLDPIEAAFFGSDPFELDWEPRVALTSTTRAALRAMLGVLAIAIVALGALLIHAHWFMPVPEELLDTHAIELPQPPPTAARASSPNAG